MEGLRILASGSETSLSSSDSGSAGRYCGRCLLRRASTIESSSSSSLGSTTGASFSSEISSSSPHHRLVSASTSSSTWSMSFTELSTDGRLAGFLNTGSSTTSICALLACFLTTLLTKVFAYSKLVFFPKSISVVPLRTLLSRCFFSGLARLSSLSFLKSLLLLSTGRKIRCFLGVSASEAVTLFGTRNESSASCDEELVYRRPRFNCFGIRIEFSSSEEVEYWTERVAFLGLERVALVALGGIKIVGSFGLGLRRRAIL